jgi:hypothetical protein
MSFLFPSVITPYPKLSKFPTMSSSAIMPCYPPPCCPPPCRPRPCHPLPSRPHHPSSPTHMSQFVPLSPNSLPEMIVPCLELIGLFCMTFASLTSITRSRPLLVESNGRDDFYQMAEILVIIQMSDALPRKFIQPCFHPFRCPHILINLRILIRTAC